ncbi:Protease, Mu phage/prophage I type [Comamonadaceae bacterium]
MKRSIIAIAARHFLLAEGDAAPGVVRFISQAIELAEGARQTWVTITRTGDFSDPRYGDFKITPTHLDQMVSNFNNRTLGQDVFLDVAHRPSDGAAGKFVKLAVEGNKLRGLVEWTPFGTDAVKTRGFAYLSAEYHENFKDNEQQAAHGCVLLGAGLTTRPVIKHLDPVQLSDDNDHGTKVRTVISPSLFKELSEQTMNKYLQALLARLIKLGFTEAAAQPLVDAAKPQVEAAGADETKCLAVVESFAVTAEAGMKAATGSGADPKHVVIQLAAPQTLDVAGLVAKALSDARAAEQQATTALDGKLKLLSETIADGDKTLTPEGVKKFSNDYAPMITALTTDEQVKHLASLAINQAKELSAARKLTGLGYNPAGGHIHISVDSSNGIKALQAQADTRLGLRDDDPQRFAKTGGVLLKANKEFAEKALAKFDAERGAELDAEHKSLAAGSGSVSDLRVPVVFERTVLREMLYNLVSLNFMDTGTYAFGNSIEIPYSYRDTTAATMNSLRVYERGAIQNAGIIQTSDTAYPIPQKLAFDISNEMRYLLGSSPIDFEPVAENTRNVIRIVGEDTEALNMNELVRAADEHLAVTQSDTLTAAVNGTNRTFVLSQFPVVRPRSIFDLKGNQIGNTGNPIVVTLNSVVRAEYNGTNTQSAGIYYTLDYNLGELRFVSELGASVAPTNAWPLTVSYSYTQNCSKFDLDLGTLSVKDKFDLLLTAIGNRKVVIGNDRFYNPNMVLMSQAVDNSVTQAGTFTANGARTGTSLAPDGSVGVTKGMQTFNTTAPGIFMGDNRILVGERYNSRYRLMKPFAMTPLEQKKNALGAFVGAMTGYGDQFLAVHTPINRRNAMTSIVLFSATARVNRTTA